MFSPTEQKIIKLIANRKIKISELADSFYEDGDEPINPGNAVSGAILRINKKCVFHDLNWYIEGEGLGRHGKKVWKKKR